MFTGLIERTAKVSALALSSKNSAKLTLQWDPNEGEFEAQIGDSIAINGCCLTLVEKHVEKQGQQYLFDLSAETLQRCNLSELKVNDEVNLERAMKLSDRLGGHLVSGHIDGQAKVLVWSALVDGFYELTIAIPQESSDFVIPKGSITLDGVSLTINRIERLDEHLNLTMTIIPETQKKTIFHGCRVGINLNVEYDLIGKYVQARLKGY